MPMANRKLGDVLLHIYEFDLGGAIYLPDVERYETDTPCIVAWGHEGEDVLHQACFRQGFKNWLNVAVVSDTCDEASEQTEESLVASFNKDCREGGWLRKMTNYGNTDSSP
jgi:hypothetical protein